MCFYLGAPYSFTNVSLICCCYYYGYSCWTTNQCCQHYFLIADRAHQTSPEKGINARPLLLSVSVTGPVVAQRVGRGIALLFQDHGTRREWVVSVTPWPLFTLGKDPVSIVQEAGWAPGPVWTCAENLAPTGIWSPHRPARSQSLYRLRHRAPLLLYF